MSTRKALNLILFSVSQNELYKRVILAFWFMRKKAMRIPELLLGCTDSLTAFYTDKSLSFSYLDPSVNSLKSIHSNQRKATLFFIVLQWFRQYQPILFSLPAKILQSYLLTLKSYWVHEKNLLTPCWWLAQKKWYELSVSKLFHYIFSKHKVCNSPRKN